jgi:hypothetical protein
MHTLSPFAWTASSPQTGYAVVLSQEPIGGGDRAVRTLTMIIIVVLVVLTLQTVGRALAPIVELARIFVAASLAAVLILAALVLVVVVAIDYP